MSCCVICTIVHIDACIELSIVEFRLCYLSHSIIYTYISIALLASHKIWNVSCIRYGAKRIQLTKSARVQKKWKAKEKIKRKSSVTDLIATMTDLIIIAILFIQHFNILHLRENIALHSAFYFSSASSQSVLLLLAEKWCGCAIVQDSPEFHTTEKSRMLRIYVFVFFFFFFMQMVINSNKKYCAQGQKYTFQEMWLS